MARVFAAAVFLGLVLVPVAHARQALDSIRSADDYLARMDGNGDGRVSLDEYLAYMLQGFDAMDRNRDGRLTADEHPGASRAPILRSDYRARLVDGFRRQDRNGDGYLDARELAAPPR